LVEVEDVGAEGERLPDGVADGDEVGERDDLLGGSEDRGRVEGGDGRLLPPLGAAGQEAGEERDHEADLGAAHAQHLVELGASGQPDEAPYEQPRGEQGGRDRCAAREDSMATFSVRQRAGAHDQQQRQKIQDRYREAAECDAVSQIDTQVHGARQRNHDRHLMWPAEGCVRKRDQGGEDDSRVARGCQNTDAKTAEHRRGEPGGVRARWR